MSLKQRARVDGVEYEFTSDEIRTDRWRISLDGKTFEIDLRALGSGSFSALIGTRSCYLEVERESDELVIITRQYRLRVELGNPGGRTVPQAVGSHPSGKVEVKAMMPGRVVSVLVKTGVEVEAGQGLVVLEAMKMENELKSPKSGRVGEVRVTAEETVEQGQVLVIIE